jgi:hypothetical protein
MHRQIARIRQDLRQPRVRRTVHVMPRGVSEGGRLTEPSAEPRHGQAWRNDGARSVCVHDAASAAHALRLWQGNQTGDPC